MLLAASVLVAIQGFRLIYGVRNGGGAKAVDGADLLIAVFLAYAGFRYAMAPVEFVARLEFLSMMAYASVFWIGRYAITRRNHGMFVLWVMLSVAVGVTFFAFLLSKNPQWRPFGEELHLHYAPRWLGSYGCPNHYGGMAVMGAAIALSIGLFSRYPWVARIVCLYLAGILAMGIFLSGSRGSWIGLLTVLTVLMIFAARHGNLRWYWPVGAYTLLLGGVAAFLLLNETTRGRLDDAIRILMNDHLDAYVRVILARDALLIFHDYPIFGSGPATFAYMHPRYQDNLYSSDAIYTHNDYLNLLSDYGATGFVICMLFLYAVTRKLGVYLGAKPDPRDRVMLAAGIASWWALLLHSVVDFNMHIPANAFWLFTLAGLGLRAASNAQPADGLLPASSLARPMAWAAWAGAGALAMATLFTARAYYPFFFAQQNFSTRPLSETVEKAKAAAEADPSSVQNQLLVGHLYLNMANAETHFDVRLPLAQQAAYWYGRAAAVNPIDDSIWIYRGWAHDLMGRFPEAFFMYEAALKNQPYNGFFHYWRGNHLWLRRELEAARESFLVGVKCPFGREENARALAEINRVLVDNPTQPPPVSTLPPSKPAGGTDDGWKSTYSPEPITEPTVP
jgi:O-antigen ligase